MTVNWKVLCAELVNAWDSTSDFDYNDFGNAVKPLVACARTALAQPEPEQPTDEELLKLMPEQLCKDLAEASRICAIHVGCEAGPIRVTLNTGIAEHCRAVLARWGKPDRPASRVNEQENERRFKECLRMIKNITHEEFVELMGEDFLNEFRRVCQRQPSPPSQSTGLVKLRSHSGIAIELPINQPAKQ